MISLNHDVGSISAKSRSDQNLGWNPRIKFSAILLDLVSAWSLLRDVLIRSNLADKSSRETIRSDTKHPGSSISHLHVVASVGLAISANSLLFLGVCSRSTTCILVR